MNPPTETDRPFTDHAQEVGLHTYVLTCKVYGTTSLIGMSESELLAEIAKREAAVTRYADVISPLLAAMPDEEHRSPEQDLAAAAMQLVHDEIINQLCDAEAALAGVRARTA